MQMDNLPVCIYVDYSRTYGPSKRQHGLIYRNSYRNNRHSQSLGIIVILIVDCEIGGSPLAIAVHRKYSLDSLRRINPERGVWG